MDFERLTLIGCGNMGGAILEGVLGSNLYVPGNLLVVETSKDRAEQVESVHGVEVVDAVNGDVGDVVVAVLPHEVEALCQSLTGVKRLLSVVAGVRIHQLESFLGTAGSGGRTAVFRSMPNTPAAVGMSATGLASGGGATADDKKWATSVLQAIGSVELVPESFLDAVTGVAGSGVAFLFVVAEAIVEGGVLQGLPRPVSERLVGNTIRGAGEMLLQEHALPSVLRGDVTSPGGTTAAGLRALENRAVRAAFIEAVEAATRRSIELADS